MLFFGLLASTAIIYFKMPTQEPTHTSDIIAKDSQAIAAWWESHVVFVDGHAILQTSKHNTCSEAEQPRYLFVCMCILDIL